MRPNQWCVHVDLARLITLGLRVPVGAAAVRNVPPEMSTSRRPSLYTRGWDDLAKNDMAWRGIAALCEQFCTNGLWQSLPPLPRRSNTACLVLASVLTVALLMGGDGANTVTYVSHEKVTAAFVKGGGLAKGPDYSVGAMFRSASGAAELHDKQTDVYYVADGEATFVTGGKLGNIRERALRAERSGISPKAMCSRFLPAYRTGSRKFRIMCATC